MFRCRVLLLCLSVSLAALTSAQTTTGVLTKDPQAIALAARALLAMGGQQAIADSRTTGTLTLGSDPSSVLPIVLESQGTHKARTAVQRATGTSVRIMNGGAAGLQRADGSARTLLSKNSISERITYIPALSLLSEFQNANVEIALSSVPNTFTLSCIPDSTKADFYRAATKTTYAADPASGLIISMEITNFAEEDPASGVPEKTVFSDYRLVSGVMVPFHQTGYMNGKLQFDLTLDSVAFNVGVPDSDFVLPAGVTYVQ